MWNTTGLRAGATLGLALGLMVVLGIKAGAVPPNRPVISRSGQFIVTDTRVNPGVGHPPRPMTPEKGVLDLAPETLAVSCERVKKEILTLFGLRDQWRANGHRTGKIYLSIDPTVRTNTPLTVLACAFEQGWQFHIAVPPKDTEGRIVRVLVQAILTELASRTGNARTGEPPLWLVEGLTRHVLEGAAVPSVLQPESRLVTEVEIGLYVREMRKRLSQEVPLEFHELSQPDIARMDEQQWEVYGACAHLFLRELLRIPEGRDRLVRWLTTLQSHWNWQSGFLEAFDPIFRSLLEVEKWWALTLAHFTTRNLVQAWPADVVLRKMEIALQPVTVLPQSGNQVARLRLSEVISEWEHGRQLPVLRQFMQQMQIIAASAPPDLGHLAMRYAGVIERYLTDRSRAGYAPAGRGQTIQTIRGVQQSALASLEELDRERERFREQLLAAESKTE